MTNQSQAVAGGDRPLPKPSLLWTAPRIFGYTFEQVQAILSEGTASLVAENERLRAERETIEANWTKVYKEALESLRICADQRDANQERLAESNRVANAFELEAIALRTQLAEEAGAVDAFMKQSDELRAHLAESDGLLERYKQECTRWAVLAATDAAQIVEANQRIEYLSKMHALAADGETTAKRELAEAQKEARDLRERIGPSLHGGMP